MEQASILEGYQEYGKHTAPEQRKTGFFASKPDTTANPFPASDVTDQLRELSRRLRILEERYASQRKNIQVLEHNVLAENKKMQAQLRTVQSDNDDLKKQLYEMKQKFDLIGSELSDTAKRQDVIVLEKYINLWEPLNFVTRNEVEKLINSLIEGKRSVSKPVKTKDEE